MRVAVLCVLVISTAAGADVPHTPPVFEATLEGRVTDAQTGVPVEGALVMVSGPNGLVATLHTDAHGRYSARVLPNTYNVIFAYGASRTSGRVDVLGLSTLDGKLDALAGEVIIIQDKIAPPVPPKPKNYKPHKAPPYSDAAVLSDAWTKAHMLLDVDEQGIVRRYKFLKRPGYDLEKIAAREVSQLVFEPARDAAGKPMRAWVVWSIEWPSAWWMAKFVGTRSGMPPVVGFPPRRLDSYVPCRGSGPMNLGSVHPTYKDCSRPDLRNASTETWQDAVSPSNR